MSQRPIDERRARELARSDAYEVAGLRLADVFFRNVGSLIPDATTLYVEGAAIAPAVREALYSHAETTLWASGPDRGTRLPAASVFRARLSSELLETLATVASHHAEPEICDHIHFYQANAPLLNWYDAFDGPFLLSRGVPELRLRRFAQLTAATWHAAR